MTPPRSRFRRRYAIAVLAIATAWIGVALWVVPWLIDQAYHGRSASFLNSLIRGQDRHGVEHYQGLWKRLSVSVSVAFAAASLLGAWLIPAAGQLRQRLSERTSSLLPSLGPVGLASMIVVAAVFGGVAEASQKIIQDRLAHEPSGDITSGEAFWMGPLAAFALLGIMLLILLVIEKASRGRIPATRLATLAAWSVVFFGLLTVLELGFAWYATWILAIGLASLLARAISVSIPEFTRVAPLGLVPVVLAIAAWGIAVPLMRTSKSNAAEHALSTATRGQPNVLVLIWDTARAASMSLYGYERSTTPNVDRFAAKGTTFERAFATSPWSLPSHASIFTGRYPNELSTSFRIPLDTVHATIGEAMQRAGYVTGGFTANLFYGGPSYGIARGFTTYDARPPLDASVIALGWYASARTYEWALRQVGSHQRLQRRRADHVNNAFFRWIGRRGERPFFAVLNHFDAHEPYAPPPPFDTTFATAEQRYWYDEAQHDFTPKDLRDFQDTYDSAMRYLDQQFQHLLDGLRARGLLDNTIIILTSDHGEEFGEHGSYLIGHMKSLYSGALHVPLVIVDPRGLIPAGTRRSDVVSIRDIPATVLDLAGVRTPAPFPGASLAPIARGEVVSDGVRYAVVEKHPWGSVQPAWPSAQGNLYSIIAGPSHLIVDATQRESLFDLDTDYWERSNLADSDGRLPKIRVALDSVFGTGKARRARAPFVN